MNNAQSGITILNIVDDNADSQEIIDLVELFVLGVHLVIDTVDVLRASREISFDAHFIQLGADAADDTVNELLAFCPFLVYKIGNPVILLRIEVTERNILHLPLDRRDPQPVRNGTKDLQRLIRNPALTLFGLVFERTHIMQTVRQLNHDHPDILGHSDEHLAVVLVLLLFLGAEADAFQLGQTVHQHRAGIAELRADLFQGHRRIFHNIMQQRSNNGYHIHLHIDDNICDRQRMQNVWLPDLRTCP